MLVTEVASSPRNILLVTCAAALCVSCALLRPAPRGPAPPAVSELQYKSVENMASEFGYVAGEGVQVSLKPHETLIAEPVYFSKHPLYGEIVLGDSEDKTYTVVIDESKGTRSGYDMLYVDANNNEDLTDDLKLIGKTLDDGRRTEFSPVEVTVAYGSQNYPYRLTPMIRAYREVELRWVPSGYCDGELRFGDKPYKVALFDDSCNGLFNDAWNVPGASRHRSSEASSGPGDLMLIDVNGDGTFKKDRGDWRESYLVGKYIPFGDTCYEMHIEPNGRRISVREAEVACGYITTIHKEYCLDLVGAEGTVRLNGTGSRVRVPSGAYKLAFCKLEGKDKGGAVWRIFGGGVSDQPIQVNPNRKTPLRFGPPLKASILPNEDGDSFRFGVKIAGQGGETYEFGRFERDGARVDPPGFEIRNNKGEVVVRGNFEYG